MSWITILWSMAAAAALTLGCIHLVVWFYDRKARASLAFSVVAFAVAGMAPTELGMMRSATPDEWGRWVQWFHVPLAFALMGTVAFVRLYLGTGKTWLAWTIVAIRCVVLIGNFVRPPNFTYREVSTLAEVPFLGEHVMTRGKFVLSSWQWLPTASVLLLAVFVVHASVECWRDRGEGRRRALVVGGGIVAFVVLSIGQTQLMVWGFIQMPVLMSPPFLIPLVAMAWEISRDVLSSRRAQRETQQLRHELAHTARIGTMGRLASALAHELRQPLGAIQRNVEAADLLLKTDAPDLEELREIIADIHRDDQRAGAVIARLRASLEKRSVDVRPLSVQELLRETVALVRPEVAARGATLECLAPVDLPPASGDWVHVSQVVLNLILNGLDAVEGCSEGARKVVIAARSESSALLEISVTDSGPGVAEENLERIFEPFFTTKPNGMGMGLTLSRSIIEANGGRLWAERRMGGGACFRFTLVASSASAKVIQTSLPLERAIPQ